MSYSSYSNDISAVDKNDGLTKGKMPVQTSNLDELMQLYKKSDRNDQENAKKPIAYWVASILLTTACVCLGVFVTPWTLFTAILPAIAIFFAIKTTSTYNKRSFENMADEEMESQKQLYENYNNAEKSHMQEKGEMIENRSMMHTKAQNYIISNDLATQVIQKTNNSYGELLKGAKENKKLKASLGKNDKLTLSGLDTLAEVKEMIAKNNKTFF